MHGFRYALDMDIVTRRYRGLAPQRKQKADASKVSFNLSLSILASTDLICFSAKPNLKSYKNHETISLKSWLSTFILISDMHAVA